jgi:hypothetical protein
MEGVDFAFYQRRSKYHTQYDSIPSADGGRDSIWAMLESIKSAGVSLLDNANTHVENGKPEPPVYFDRECTYSLKFRPLLMNFSV